MGRKSTLFFSRKRKTHEVISKEKHSNPTAVTILGLHMKVDYDCINAFPVSLKTSTPRRDTSFAV